MIKTGFVAQIRLPDGRVGEKYFDSEQDIEAWKRAHPGGKVFNIRKKTPGHGVIKKPDANAVLLGKYGISLNQLKQIVATSKSQPEAIKRVRVLLHGTDRYDPRYIEVERLVNALWDAKTHPEIPNTKRNVEDELKHLVVANSPHQHGREERAVYKREQTKEQEVMKETVIHTARPRRTLWRSKNLKVVIAGGLILAGVGWYVLTR